MEMCDYKQAAREADVAASLAAKLQALGNVTNLPMSASSLPFSDTPSSRGSSLSSYAVRANPAILIRPQYNRRSGPAQNVLLNQMEISCMQK
jgi:hypothetical protein